MNLLKLKELIQLKNKKGFSLIELICTIGCMLIISSIIISFQISRDREVKSFIREFVADVKYVRMQSILGSYHSMIVERNSQDKTVEYKVIKFRRRVKNMVSPKDVVVYGNPQEIKFTPSGRYLNSESGTYTFIDLRNNKKYNVTVVFASGRILFKEGFYEWK